MCAVCRHIIICCTHVCAVYTAAHVCAVCRHIVICCTHVCAVYTAAHACVLCAGTLSSAAHTCVLYTLLHTRVCCVQAHCHLLVVEAFAERLSELRESSAETAVLTDLFRLYAAYGIAISSAHFTEVMLSVIVLCTAVCACVCFIAISSADFTEVMLSIIVSCTAMCACVFRGGLLCHF